MYLMQTVQWFKLKYKYQNNIYSKMCKNVSSTKKILFLST